jgi:serine/threonine-protein kinase
VSTAAGSRVEGTSIGRYRIEALIGSGGMGAVYRAVDPLLRRVVAIKVLAAAHDDETAQERFFREARAIARLEHRNIVRIYEADAPEGTPYIAMEFLEGQDGRQFVKSSPSLSRGLDVMVQVFEGLACAHGLGVIHRDVKPGNMIVLPGDVVKLIDFGLARLADDQRDLTRGQVFGSAPFMAPEQITNPSQIDARTDVYSAGVVLYCLVTGALPYKGATVAETLVQIVHAPQPDITSLRPDCPSDVAALVRRCLAKDPSERPASALEAAETLRRIAHRIASPRIPLPPPLPPLPDFALTFSEPIAELEVAPAPPAEDVLTQYDLLGSSGPSTSAPESAPPGLAARSMSPIALTIAAVGLILAVGAGTVLWLRRSASISPGKDGPTLLLPPLQTSAGANSGQVTSEDAGPRLVVEEPVSRKPRIRSGESLPLRVRVEGAGLIAAEPQWQLNGEVVASGSSWTYTARSGRRVDLVTVSLPGVAVTPRTIVVWNVSVE